MSKSHDIDSLVGTPDPDFTHILSCVFGIREHESRTYLALREYPGTTVEELATELERDRSNVNRSLSTLQEKGLADRERRLLDSGGYVYQYTAVPLPEAKEMLHDALDDWVTAVHAEIENYGDK